VKSVQRRKEILEVIQKQGGISVGEIAERFAVSRMTGHRDLECLERRGAIKRIFGGAVPVAGKETAGPPAAGKSSLIDTSPESAKRCIVCQRPAAQNLLYTLTLRSGEQRFACCPHCGISSHLVLRDEVSLAMTADYLSGRQHPARQSFFLLGSAAAPCCHPSMLTFQDEEMARRFQSGFGGTLGRLEDAVTFLQETMSADGRSCPHCGPDGHAEGLEGELKK
jgi:hypothetical protein